ncbi:Transcriptional regulator of nonfermentable carbon utilization [Linnemannia schmuckeri]|uniref:Transcriptional regulator of nonfermentable carbon utilization n=1 Tax=Linnemannia schmuckeri TaxID=64567 RepID=A0A9P5VD85_9FUNG|nr:Transcriptional regulator of nonfermentable carbon utilization [Linnemannia schmuckeri]
MGHPNARPCQRCVKRDLASTCADGVRKKAKYLQDAYDSQQVAAEQAAQGGNMNAMGIDQKALLSDQDQQRQGPGGMEESPLTDANALFNFPMNSDYGFGSEAVNLEYSIISTMLSSPTAELNSMSDLSMVENWQRQGSLEAMTNLANSNQLQKALAAQGAAAAAAAASIGPGPGSAASGSNAGLPNAGATNHANGTSTNNNSHNNINNSANNTANNTSSSTANNATMGLLGPGVPAANNATAPTGFHPPGVARVSKRKFPSNTPENVYANTKQPFNYTDGFHYLLRYVRERMDKEEMMRICRAMAMFRPSFIALIMNLTPEDLIFMEKCFQRTILEFEKLISFSGTPTVVWRRTGEIALVGKEFSLLTQWGRDQLVGKKTYIYELMDNQSAVEYWEKFSTHAFENTEQTVMTTCILLSPTNRVVPCTFCFTIKRDIFDIPLAIVGNFLPILS